MVDAIPSQVAIIANGLLEHSAHILNRIRSFSFLIAVDGGCNTCQYLQLQPDLIIGDMDSVDQTTLNHYSQVPQIRFPREKDVTDLDLAVSHAFAKGAKNVTIFGGLGKRIDHTLSNLILMTRYPEKVTLETEEERLVAIHEKIELSCYIGQTISLIPMNGPVTGISTEGLKWPLIEGKLDKQFIGISNEAIQEHVKIRVKQGDLLCVVNLRG